MCCYLIFYPYTVWYVPLSVQHKDFAEIFHNLRNTCDSKNVLEASSIYCILRKEWPVDVRVKPVAVHRISEM
jgi:hypothetical protein